MPRFPSGNKYAIIIKIGISEEFLHLENSF